MSSPTATSGRTSPVACPLAAALPYRFRIFLLYGTAVPDDLNHVLDDVPGDAPWRRGAQGERRTPVERDQGGDPLARDGEAEFVVVAGGDLQRRVLQARERRGEHRPARGLQLKLEDRQIAVAQ